MRRANGTGHVFKMKEKGRRNPWRVRITVGWEMNEATGKQNRLLRRLDITRQGRRRRQP